MPNNEPAEKGLISTILRLRQPQPSDIRKITFFLKHVISGVAVAMLLVTFFLANDFFENPQTIEKFEKGLGKEWTAGSIRVLAISALAGVGLGVVFWLARLAEIESRRRIYQRRKQQRKSVFPKELNMPPRTSKPPAFESRMSQFKKNSPSNSQPVPPPTKTTLWVSPDLYTEDNPPRPSSFFRRILERIRSLVRPGMNKHGA